MTSIETVLTIVLLGIGTARFSVLLVLDDITEPFRDLLFTYFPPEDNDELGRYYQGMRKVTAQERSQLDKLNLPWWQRRFEWNGDTIREPAFIGRLFACHKCIAVWVAMLNTILLYAHYDAWLVINTILAGSFVSTAAVTRYWR